MILLHPPQFQGLCAAPKNYSIFHHDYSTLSRLLLHIVCSGLIKLTFNCLLLRLIIGVGKTEGGPHIRSVWRKKVGAINLYTYDWIIAVPAELAQRATTHLDFHSHSHPHYARGVVLKPKRGWGRGSRGQVEQNSAKLN